MIWSEHYQQASLTAPALFQSSHFSAWSHGRPCLLCWKRMKFCRYSEKLDSTARSVFNSQQRCKEFSLSSLVLNFVSMSLQMHISMEYWFTIALQNQESRNVISCLFAWTYFPCTENSSGNYSLQLESNEWKEVQSIRGRKRNQTSFIQNTNLHNYSSTCKM